MGYTAGTLDLSILGASDSAVASIDKIVKSLNSLSRSIQIFAKTDINKTFSKLAESVNIFSQSAKNLDVSGFEKLSVIGTTGKGINSLANAINKLNASSTVFATQQISNLFEKLSISSQKIDTTALSNLSSVGKSLSSISNISRLDKIDWDKAGQGFQNLAVSITPFIAKIKEAEASLTALYGILNKTSGKNSDNLLNGKSSSSFSLKNLFSSFGRFFKVANFITVTHYARRLGQYMYKVVDLGSDYGETLNLWTVAMKKEFLPQATEFVNKLNEAYGISKETLMNSQAIFKNMLGSLGQISDETAYRLSEGITQMALDYASLYNVQFEDAMTKFQAALAGQVRPIRSVSGYDITENTLFQLYQELGGTKTMRQLSRTEKQLLAIYAVFEQMNKSGAVGDLDRTINSFANQSRVTQDAWKDIQTYAGLTVTRILEQYEVMKYVNAVLIFMSRILEGLATSLDTGLGNSGDAFGDMENGALNATDAVEELKSSLLDFDKFRALDQTSAVENALGIDQTILDAMTQYESILEGAELTAREIADAWLEALGFVDKNNDEIVDMDESLENFRQNISNIDWENLGKEFSEGAILRLEEMTKAINDIDWAKLGEDFGSFINEIDWNAVFLATGEFVGALTTALIEVIVGAITKIDWVKLLGGVIFGPWLSLIRAEEKILQIPQGFRPTDLIFNDKFFDFWYKWFSGAKLFARGGLPDKGSMFVAGEAGAEIVYNMPSGQSGVANVQQIAQATYSGTMRALRDWWGGSQAKGDIPQLKEANATGMYQAVTGVAKSQGKVWANV